MDYKKIANRSIAILFYETEGILEIPKIIQSHLKHCIHSLVKDVCSEQEAYNGKVRTPAEWASRQIAHTLGDIEEIKYELPENISKAIKSIMYNTAEVAGNKYGQNTEDESEE
jgi:hypothetical protein